MVHALAAALTVVLLARLLPKEEYGHYVYYSTWAALLPLFLGLGVEHVLIMHGSRTAAEIPFLFGNALVVRLTASGTILAGSIVYFLLSSGPHALAIALIFVGGSWTVFAAPLFLALYRVNDVHVRPWVLGLVGVLGFPLYLAAIPRTWISLNTVALGYCAAQTITAAIMYPDVRRLGKPVARLDRWRRHSRLGLSFAASQTLDYATARMDIFALQQMAGPAAVGLYAVGQRIIGVLQIIPTSIHLTELPDFHRNASNEEALTSRFRALRAILLDASILIGGGIMLFASVVVVLLFGEQYREGARALRWLAVANVFVFLNYPYYMLAEAMDQVGRRLLAKVVTALITLAALAVLIPRLGIEGASISMVIGNVVFVAGLHWLTRSRSGSLGGLLWDARSLAVAVAGGLAVVAFSSLSQVSSGVTFLVLGCMIYVVSVFGLGLLFKLTSARLIARLVLSVIQKGRRST